MTPSKTGLACDDCVHVWCIQRRRVVQLEAQLAARDTEHSRRTELAREVLREFSGRAAGGAMWCPCCSRTVDDCATRNNIGARARAALKALEER